MSITARQLVDIEQTGPTRFRGRHNQRNHTEALYGGQCLAKRSRLRRVQRPVSRRIRSTAIFSAAAP